MKLETSRGVISLKKTDRILSGAIIARRVDMIKREQPDRPRKEYWTVNRYSSPTWLEGERMTNTVPLHLCNETPKGLQQWGEEFTAIDQDPELIESDMGNHPNGEAREHFASGEFGSLLEDVCFQYGASAARWIEHVWQPMPDHEKRAFLAGATDNQGKPLKLNAFNACKVSGYRPRPVWKGLQRWRDR